MQVTVYDIASFYDAHPECIGELEVETRYGFKEIEFADVSAEDSQVVRVTLANGRSIETSPEHRLWVNDGWKAVDQIAVGDHCWCKGGPVAVASIEVLDFTEDLYDLQVADVHEYFANGFVSHNSTLLDALSFGLFGSPFRSINKPQLVNSVTRRELVVEVEFTANGKRYFVRRGLKPSLFEIMVDDELVDQPDAREYQAYLERRILGMNQKSFKQIVVVGSAIFVPFMQLTAAARREFIEDLLDIQVFSRMSVLAKDCLREATEAHSSAEERVRAAQQRLEMEKRHASEMERSIDDVVRQKKTQIMMLEERVSHLIEEEAAAVRELDAARAVEAKLASDKPRDRVVELKSLQAKIMGRREILERELIFYRGNSDCPACGQGIEHGHRTGKIESLSTEIARIDGGLKMMEVQIAAQIDRSAALDAARRAHASAAAKRHSADGSVRFMKQQLSTAKTELESLSEKAEKTRIAVDVVSASRDLAEASTALEEATVARSDLSVASKLLRDGSIKAMIIRQYIPVINQLVNKYLAAMDFFVSFELDEDFNETIKSRGRDDFSYGSFSEGEKMRIDLALLFAWRAVARLRNSVSTNLLVMDEVFDSSLDASGMDEFMKILHGLTEDTNLFVISHRGDQLFDKFHSAIRFEKHRSFSRIAATA